jgi:membrane protein implicated in regulation of membrane protease activity
MAMEIHTFLVAGGFLLVASVLVLKMYLEAMVRWAHREEKEGLDAETKKYCAEVRCYYEAIFRTASAFTAVLLIIMGIRLWLPAPFIVLDVLLTVVFAFYVVLAIMALARAYYLTVEEYKKKKAEEIDC